MRFQTSRSPEPVFNLTPLIDILFIVLIFLVLTTTFRDATAFRVNLPETTTGERQTQTHPGVVTITVSEDGTVEVDRDPVTLQQLAGRLATIEETERAVVRLRADAGVSHGLVVQVMDIVRRRGITQLTIETRPADRY